MGRELILTQTDFIRLKLKWYHATSNYNTLDRVHLFDEWIKTQGVWRYESKWAHTFETVVLSFKSEEHATAFVLVNL